MTDWRKAILAEAAGKGKADVPEIRTVHVPVRTRKVRETHPCEDCGGPAPIRKKYCGKCFKARRKKRR